MRARIKEQIEAAKARNIGADERGRTSTPFREPDPKSVLRGARKCRSEQPKEPAGWWEGRDAPTYLLDSYNFGYTGRHGVDVCSDPALLSRAVSSFRSSQAASIEQGLTMENIRQRLRAGFFECRCIEIPNSVPSDQVRRLRYEFQTMRASAAESKFHRELKLLTAEWLRSLGATDAEYEPYDTPVRGDVASEQLRIMAECGNTDPARIFTVLRDGWKLAMVPYGAMDEDATTPVFLFRMTAIALLRCQIHERRTQRFYGACA